MKIKITNILSNIGILFKWIPEKYCVFLLSAIGWSLATGRKPEDGLKLLLRLNNKIYSFTGQIACDYGNGLHPKHRLMHYHEFFINRINSDERVVDIGCGNGALAYDIAKYSGAYVTGIDFNKSSILEANKRYKHDRISYIHTDILKKMPNEFFNVAVLSNVLEHISDRVSFLCAVQERYNIERWLIRVPLYERDWRVPMMEELDIDYRLDKTHYTEYTQESFVNEISKAGFKIVYQEIRWGEIWAELTP